MYGVALPGVEHLCIVSQNLHVSGLTPLTDQQPNTTNKIHTLDTWDTSTYCKVNPTSFPFTCTCAHTGL